MNRGDLILIEGRKILWDESEGGTLEFYRVHNLKKFNNTGEGMDDLISIETIGLIKAIESYRLSKGTKLDILLPVV